MENALIVSHSEKSPASFTEMLKAASMKRITIVESAGAARRMLLEQDFDLVLVQAPLRDESGECLARQIVSKGTTQVILIVKSEHFDAISAACENDGVLVITKPVERAFFGVALTLAKAAQNRIKNVQAENEWLKLKMEDIRLVDRAKWKLVSHLKLSEQDAHRFIEKQSMDRRSTKKAIAKEILKMYEN